MAELTTPTTRRTRRGQPADLGAFTGQVDAALHAFAEDVCYAVAMARAAVVSDRKRRVWQARKDLRDAETRAHTECRDTGEFDCHAESPCGTGDCKFATGDHAHLAVPAPGRTARPQRSNPTTYSLEPAVAALADRGAAAL